MRKSLVAVILFLLDKLPLQCDELLGQKYSSQRALLLQKRTWKKTTVLQIVFIERSEKAQQAKNIWERSSVDPV